MVVDLPVDANWVQSFYFIGVVAVLISLIVESFGAIGGYYGGKVDAIMWNDYLVHTHTSRYCYYYLALGSFLAGFVAVGLTMWVEVARVVRGGSLVEMQYVTAARALGFWGFRTFLIIFNIMAPVIVISAANFASAILVESFLGLGAQPLYQLGSIIEDHSYIILVNRIWLWFLV
jgi:peptide/nickel transport system permease protein